MKKLHLLKTMLLLCALIVGSSSVWAENITFDFEADGSHRSSGANSYSSNNYTQNGVSISLTYADAVSSGTPLSGSYHVIGRIAAKTQNSPVIKIGAVSITNKKVTQVSYKTKGMAAMRMSVEYSTDNSSWTNLETLTSMPTNATEKTIGNLDITGTNFYVRFTVTVSSKTDSKRDFNLDDIVISLAPASSDPILSVDPETASPFVYEYGEGPSEDQSFEISGNNLTSGITASISGDYEMTSDTSYGTSNLSLSSGDVVYVRLKAGLAIGTHDGTLTFSSTGADNVVINLSGSVSKPAAGLSYTITSYRVPFATIFPTPTLSNPNGLLVTYTTSDATVADVNSDGDVTIKSKAGETTITASYDGSGDYEAGNATYTITVFDASANDGSETKPYSVAEALAIIDKLADNGKTPSEVYVKGVISSGVSIDTDNGYANYYISDDGTTSSELMIYRGYNIGLYNFENNDDIKVGDKVVVYGQLQKYKSGSTTIPEFVKDNYITTLNSSQYVYVGTAKWKTYVPSNNLNVPTGLKAYIVTSSSADDVTLTSVDNIKAGTAVILNGTSDTYGDERDLDYFLEITDEAVSYPKENILKISDGTVVNGVYVLAKKNDEVGFYKWAGGSLDAGRAYIDAPAVGAHEFLGLETETTGITTISTDNSTVSNNIVYNIAGQRIAQPTKGMYIINSKKLIIK